MFMLCLAVLHVKILHVKILNVNDLQSTVAGVLEVSDSSRRRFSISRFSSSFPSPFFVLPSKTIHRISQSKQDRMQEAGCLVLEVRGPKQRLISKDEQLTLKEADLVLLLILLVLLLLLRTT